MYESARQKKDGTRLVRGLGDMYVHTCMCIKTDVYREVVGDCACLCLCRHVHFHMVFGTSTDDFVRFCLSFVALLSPAESVRERVMSIGKDRIPHRDSFLAIHLARLFTPLYLFCSCQQAPTRTSPMSVIYQYRRINLDGMLAWSSYLLSR